jgi:hypothetical protein
MSVLARAVSMLLPGNFVRVREDHKNFMRAGKDGMVIEDFGQLVALVFYYDRHNEAQGCMCVGPELWKKSELDMTTICR